MAGRKKTETVEAEVVETAVVPAGKMEFRLINPTEDGFLRRIQWNKEELEAAVRAKIAGYENVVYTEENIKAAKNDRAELNKLIKAIEERRKQVKNIINEPYAVFEAELKEITALINEPVALIDQQVKAFEEKQKEEKKAAIKATYDENIGDLAEVLPFEKIFDSRYLNQTYKLATAQKEIVDKIDTVKTDLETIEKSAFAQAVAGETQAAPAAQVVDPFAPKEEPEQEKKYRVRFFADGTKEQLGKLIAFMNENNIKYGKIAKESK